MAKIVGMWVRKDANERWHFHPTMIVAGKGGTRHVASSLSVCGVSVRSGFNVCARKRVRALFRCRACADIVAESEDWIDEEEWHTNRVLRSSVDG